MKSRENIGSIALWSFLILAVAAQFIMRRYCAPTVCRWMLFIAVIGAAVCLRKGSDDRGYVAEHDRELIYQPRLPMRIVALLLATAGVFLLILSCRRLTIAWSATYYRSFLFMISGFILTAFGMDHLLGYRVRYRLMTASQKQWEIMLLILIMAMAVVLRTYRLDYYPPPDGFGAIEETQQGYRAFEMLHRGATPWEFLTSNFVTALSFALFGMSTFSLRIPPAVLSCLTLLVTYFLLRTLVGYRMALFGLLLFAVSHWHLTYSRFSHNVFLPVVLVVLTIHLLYRTPLSSRPSIYLWIGALSGVLLYEYAPYRSTIILCIIFFAERAIRGIKIRGGSGAERRFGELRAIFFRNLYKPLLLGLGVLTFAIPLTGRLKAMPGMYFEAVGRAIARETDPAWYGTSDMGRFMSMRMDRIRSGLLVFSGKGKDAAPIIVAGEPLLDPFSGIVFMLAVGYCTLSFLRERNTFMTLCFYVTTGMGFLFPHNLDVTRLIALIPQMFVLIAIFVYSLHHYARNTGGRTAALCLDLLMVIICAGSFYCNYGVFFNRQISDQKLRRALRNEYVATCELLHRVPSGYFAVVVTQDVKNLFFTPNDFEWLRGMEIKGAIVNNPEIALELGRLARKRCGVTFIINNRYGIDRCAEVVRRTFHDVTEEIISKELMDGEWAWAILNVAAEGAEGVDGVQLLEGYAGVEGTPESIRVSDFLGWVGAWRITGEGRSLSWKAEKVQRRATVEYLFIVSGQAGGGEAVAEISIFGVPRIRFSIEDGDRPRLLRGDGCIMKTLPIQGFAGKGTFYNLILSPEIVVEGKETELKLTISRGREITWFALHDRNNCWDFVKARW